MRNRSDPILFSRDVKLNITAKIALPHRGSNKILSLCRIKNAVLTTKRSMVRD